MVKREGVWDFKTKQVIHRKAKCGKEIFVGQSRNNETERNAVNRFLLRFFPSATLNSNRLR